MKAMILAAGFGKRMQPLTLTTPKPLVKVRGRALIDYHLAGLKKIAVSEVVINVHHLGEQIIDYVKQHWGDDFKFYFFNEVEILGTGGGIYQALSIFEDEPFIVVSADVFTDYSFAQLPRTLNGLGHLVMVDNPLFHPLGDFCLDEHGLLSLTDGLRLTYGNISLLHPRLFASIKREKFELREVLVPAILSRLMSGEYYRGSWANMGTVEQLAAVDL